MAQACELNDDPVVVPFLVSLVESLMQMSLGATDAKDKEAWYLDMGVTNHMTSCRDVFAELNRSVTGTAKFGDGSIIDIKVLVTSSLSARMASTRFSATSTTFHASRAQTSASASLMKARRMC